MRVTATLSLPRQPSSVPRARQVLNTLLSLTEAGEERSAHLAVLISEACSNAVVHAEPASPVNVTIAIDNSECLVEVGNRSETLDGARLAPDLPDPESLSGRGLPLIAELADTAKFVPGPPGWVRLRMTKFLKPVPVPPSG